jgi:hypothetical protein
MPKSSNDYVKAGGKMPSLWVDFVEQNKLAENNIKRLPVRRSYGRQRCMAGQCVHRATVAQRQIRRDVFAGLRKRQLGTRFNRSLPQLLQGPTPAFEP